MRAQRLEAANEELEAFSYSVSHDLRAPLRHIDGFISLLEERSSSMLDEPGRRYLATIADAAKRMGTLIDDLLAFSRMSRAAMRRTRVSLRPLVEALIADLKNGFQGRRVEWRLAPLPDLECDPVMARQALANLLDNAVKFTRTRERAVIEVGAEPGTDGRVTIFVKDNGVGFDMEHAGKLFGVFQRLHRQEEFEGTGIGLAIVRRVARRHGGEAWAKSEAGKGTCFFISLPAAPKETAA